jgi:Protein of unknown function (DUF3551)
MRTLVWMVLAVGLVLAAAPAQAQTYDPNYPICMQAYGMEQGFIWCGYTSMAQCEMSASARAAQCLPNPYFAYGSTERRGRIDRRPHRAY